MKVSASMKPIEQLVGERDRPRVEEDHLDVEDDEEQRDKVVAEVELHPAIALGLDAALVGVGLHRVRRLRADLARCRKRREITSGSDGKITAKTSRMVT